MNLTFLFNRIRTYGYKPYPFYLTMLFSAYLCSLGIPMYAQKFL